jgi:predicted transcriptional regulator
MPGGRPQKVTDKEILKALPGKTADVAARVGLERSACYTRLRRLEKDGLALRQRSGYSDVWRCWDDWEDWFDGEEEG